MFDKLEEKAMVHFFNKFDKNPFLLGYVTTNS